MHNGHIRTSLDFRDGGLLESEKIMKLECTSYVWCWWQLLLFNFPPLVKPGLYVVH